MHAFAAVVSLLAVAGAGGLALLVLGLFGTRAGPLHRDVQLVVLAAPLASLGAGIAALHHFAGQVCWIGAPPWDFLLGLLIPLSMGAVAAGGAVLGVVRLVMLGRAVRAAEHAAPPALQALVDSLAPAVGAPCTRVRLCALDRPLALAYGVRRPTLLVSSWMLARLDSAEIEAVLAHELAHVARRDGLVSWLASVLRDAFCYLPAGRIAFRQLRREAELACDDLAVAATGRPLALASALAKVWAAAVGLPTLLGGERVVAAGLLGDAPAESALPIEVRITRLMAAPPGAARSPHGPSAVVSLSIALGAVLVLLALQAADAAVLLAPMACDMGGSFVSLVGLVGRLLPLG